MEADPATCAASGPSPSRGAAATAAARAVGAVGAVAPSAATVCAVTAGPAAADLLSYLQQIFMAGAQVRFDPELARPWSLLLGPQEISSATSLVDLVLQARAHAHGGSR